MDAATLRSDFPEFADVLAYTDAQINFWLGIGGKLLRPCAWDDLLDHGLELFTAHHLSLARINQKAAAKGGAPGSNSGPQASKSIDKVSVSFDTGAATIEGQGHWNLTTYGTQFIQLSRMVGMGGGAGLRRRRGNTTGFGPMAGRLPAMALMEDPHENRTNHHC